MIIERLSKIEITSKYIINSENKKLDAIRGFKELLKQIDFSSEIVPFEDSKKLIGLFASLKGKPLSKCEITLIKEIAANTIA